MPILSNLSRRFHVLTTDAKPDPPRIEINGYTHNLDPSTANNEAKSKFTPATPEPRTEETFERTSERKDSLPSDAIPTNARYSPIDRDFDDPTGSSEAKEQRKPNVKTKTKSKPYKHSQRAHVVNYNIVNSNGVKVGSRTTYICNVNNFPSKNVGSTEESWPKSETRQMSAEVERLCGCTDEITLEDIFVIKTHIGHGWKDVARRICYSDGQIEQFEENYKFRGISEVIYQIFLDWKQANTKDAEIGNLTNVLWDCQEYDCAERLASSRKNAT